MLSSTRRTLGTANARSEIMGGSDFGVYQYKPGTDGRASRLVLSAINASL